MEVEKEGGTKVKMMCDGIVCSIAQAVSRVADSKELMEAVAREFEHEEIYESWKEYFKIFNDVICKDRKKPIADIGRKDIKLCIGDIVTHLKTFERVEDLNFLMMPWDFKINPLEADSEVLARKIVEVNSNNVTEKIAEMEKRIDTKNRAYFESLQLEMRSMISDIARTPSYAGVAQAQGRGGAMGPPPPPPATTRSRATGPRGPPLGLNLQRERSSSASKRPRLDEDQEQEADISVHPPVRETQTQGRSQSKSRKYRVGTLNTREASGRKMKSPPGDVFIYGVHPDTAIEDIINDLKESDIIVEEKDVQKKSYKISVKAEDLQKALNPDIWPMRVKVREYIYYARKPQQQSDQGQGQGGYRDASRGQGNNGGYAGIGGQGGGGGPAPHAGQADHRPGARGGHEGAGELVAVARAVGVDQPVSTSNRFDLLLQDQP